ncbi:MAG: pilus assembly protein PilP [Deltaproteobacteria bacterium]|nr:pilus assembly protein PilP [Deltaproteobacteria bacterium]
MTTNRLLFLASLALLLAVPTAGCGGSAPAPAPARPSARPKPPPAPVIEEPVAAVEEPVDDYSYVSIGKRDPFRSFIEVGVVVPAGGQVGPLQLHEIDQYQLRGIVWNVGEPRAMVEDPEGIGHVVELGTLIGKNWGKVTQIKPNALIITEEYRDPIENELIINEVTMRLPDPDADGRG